MYNILVVEDTPDGQKLLEFILRPIARITTADSYQAALKAFDEDSFDLILMDVMLGDGNGFELTAELRKRPGGASVPVIFLTSLSEVSDKALGFELGAEDYIVKPYIPQELLIRIESRLKKLRAIREKEIIKRGNLRLLIPLQKIQFIEEGKYIEVTPLQFKILYYLVTHEKQTISREQLAAEIWGKGIRLGRSIDSHINSLRRKLKKYASYIRSVYGVGYIFDTEHE